MTLVQILQKLRDDLIKWSTNNFEAINAEFTNINDLIKSLDTQLGNIDGSDSDVLYVSDNNGNIIAKVNDQGVYSIDFTIPGVISLSELNRKVTNIVSSSELSSLSSQVNINTGKIDELTAKFDNIDTSDDDTFYVTDSNNNIIAKIDSAGVHSVNFLAESNGKALGNLVELASLVESHTTAINELTYKLTNLDTSDDAVFYIVDNNNNIIAKINDTGIHSINFYGQDANENIIDMRSTQETAIANSNKLANLDTNDDDTFYVIDNNSNIIAKINQAGVHSINFTAIKSDGTSTDIWTVCDATSANTTAIAAINTILNTSINETAPGLISRVTINANDIQELKDILSGVNGDSNLIGRIEAIEDDVEILTGTGEGSVTQIAAAQANAAVAAIIDGAPETFDTLKEISQWIGSNTDGAAAMASQINQNITDISVLNAKLANLDTSDDNTFYVVDNAGYIIAKINENGLTTTNITLQNNLNMQQNTIFFRESETITININ